MKSSLENILGKDWFLLEKYNDFLPEELYGFVKARAFDLKETTGKYLNSAIFYIGNTAYTCFERVSFLKNKKILFQKIIKNPNFFEKWYEREDTVIAQLIKYQILIKKRKFRYFEQWQDKFTEMAMFGQLINIIEFDDAWL